MNQTKITSAEVAPTRSYVSQAVRHGDTLYLSGMVGEGPDGKIVPGGIREQARQALTNARSILEAAGLGLKDVLICQCFISDAAYFSDMNQVYGEFFEALEVPPARYTIIGGIASPALFCEFVLTAGY